DTVRFVVDRSIAAGRVLLKGAQILRGSRAFRRWLTELGVSPATAQNYIKIAELDRHSPGLVERWKILGPAKLYRVARLNPEARQDVLKTPHLIEMTDGEFAQLSAPFRTRTRRVTGNMRGHGMTESVRGMAVRLRRFKLPH